MPEALNTTSSSRIQRDTSQSGRSATLEEGQETGGDVSLSDENASLLQKSSIMMKDVPQQTLMAGACFCLASGGMVREILLTCLVLPSLKHFDNV
jgi:hypothetical protein